MPRGAEDVVVGLFIVGESSSDGEGMLLQGTNSAQVKSAFWGRYFAPYLYFSMRYVDDAL